MELQQPKCRADTQNRKGFSLHHFCANTACWPKTMQVSLAAGFFVACQTTQQHLGDSSHAPGEGEAPSGPESPSVKVSAARSVSFLCPHTTPSWGEGVREGASHPPGTGLFWWVPSLSARRAQPPRWELPGSWGRSRQEAHPPASP